jgi:hypothetical protein
MEQGREGAGALPSARQQRMLVLGGTCRAAARRRLARPAGRGWPYSGPREAGTSGVNAGESRGRPLADRVHHSRLSNLKELRPGSAGRSEIRILYIFDPRRNAVLLVAGDKAGNWEAWYRQAIPLAEQRYEGYL